MKKLTMILMTAILFGASVAYADDSDSKVGPNQNANCKDIVAQIKSKQAAAPAAADPAAAAPAADASGK